MAVGLVAVRAEGNCAEGAIDGSAEVTRGLVLPRLMGGDQNLVGATALSCLQYRLRHLTSRRKACVSLVSDDKACVVPS